MRVYNPGTFPGAQDVQPAQLIESACHALIGRCHTVLAFQVGVELPVISWETVHAMADLAALLDEFCEQFTVEITPDGERGA